MSTDNFRQPPQAPPLFTGTPSSIVADAHRAVAARRAIADAIVQTVTPETAIFANVLRPLADAQSAATRERRVLGFYRDMATDAAVREASAEAARIMEDYALEAAMREDVFRLVDAVFKKDEVLEGEDRHYLTKQRVEYIRNGLGLPPGPQRERFKAIRERLIILSNEFRKNLNEQKGEIWLLPEDLEGMPDDFMSELRRPSLEKMLGNVASTSKTPIAAISSDRPPRVRLACAIRWPHRKNAREMSRFSEKRCCFEMRQLAC